MKFEVFLTVCVVKFIEVYIRPEPRIKKEKVIKPIPIATLKGTSSSGKSKSKNSLEYKVELKEGQSPWTLEQDLILTTLVQTEPPLSFKSIAEKLDLNYNGEECKTRWGWLKEKLDREERIANG